MRRFPILALFLALSALPVQAQSGDARFGLAIETHGGAAVASAQTLVITGQSAARGAIQPVRISASLDGSIRLDYGLPVTRSIVTVPQGRFEVRGGRIRPRPRHAGAYAALDWLAVLGIRHLAAAGVERTALGPSTLGGRAAERVRAVTGRSQTHYGRIVPDEAEVLFDLETGLVAAISRRQHADESLDLTFVLTTAFSGYRPVAGLLVPFRIERYLDGTLAETITVESVQLKPALPAGLFER